MTVIHISGVDSLIRVIIHQFFSSDIVSLEYFTAHGHALCSSDPILQINPSSAKIKLSLEMNIKQQCPFPSFFLDSN
jgi:hypothetical protein